MITVKLEYPGGLNSQLDDQIHQLAENDCGDFVASGVAIESQVRDMEFEFPYEPYADAFKASLASFINVTLKENNA